MKKLLSILALLMLFTGCSAKTSDAAKFKEDYESLNGTIREKDGETIRTIEIDENNPMIYATTQDIADMIEDEKDFIVYFGFNDCPWCRSIVPTLIDVANERGIDTIYYVDIKDIRDKYEMQDGEIVCTEEGTQGYQQMLGLLGDVLDDYAVYDDDGNEFFFGEKRIYAPNIVAVKNGKAIAKTEATSHLETDPYMELTDEMIEDTTSQLNEFFDEYLKEDEQGCDFQKKC